MALKPTTEGLTKFKKSIDKSLFTVFAFLFAFIV